jgi:hypothetical protein
MPSSSPGWSSRWTAAARSERSACAVSCVVCPLGCRRRLMAGSLWADTRCRPGAASQTRTTGHPLSDSNRSLALAAMDGPELAAMLAAAWSVEKAPKLRLRIAVLPGPLRNRRHRTRAQINCTATARASPDNTRGDIEWALLSNPASRSGTSSALRRRDACKKPLYSALSPPPRLPITQVQQMTSLRHEGQQLRRSQRSRS